MKNFVRRNFGFSFPRQREALRGARANEDIGEVR